METQKFSYDNGIVRAFLIATVVFGLVGFLLGLTAALLLFYPELPEFSWEQMTRQSERLEVKDYKALLTLRERLDLAV
jgi:cbb3-type cytochrome oxidase subunit 1